MRGKASLSPKHTIQNQVGILCSYGFYLLKSQASLTVHVEYSNCCRDRNHNQEILENTPALEKVVPISSPYSCHRKQLYT